MWCSYRFHLPARETVAQSPLAFFFPTETTSCSCSSPTQTSTRPLAPPPHLRHLTSPVQYNSCRSEEWRRRLLRELRRRRWSRWRRAGYGSRRATRFSVGGLLLHGPRIDGRRFFVRCKDVRWLRGRNQVLVAVDRGVNPQPRSTRCDSSCDVHVDGQRAIQCAVDGELDLLLHAAGCIPCAQRPAVSVLLLFLLRSRCEVPPSPFPHSRLLRLCF